jgi:hypothetical protein
MVNPVPSGIDCKWMVFNRAFVNLVTKIEQDAEGSSGKNGVGGMGQDVIARKMVFRIGEARRRQELFHGEVRKLDDR